jgi:hypothetical protein
MAELLTARGVVADGRDGQADWKPKERIYNAISRNISPYLSTRVEEWRRELEQIMDDAIAFDREMSRQLTCIEWVFAAGDAGTGGMVLQPALVRRGKSTGEDYGTPRVLLDAVLAQEAPERVAVAGGNRPSRPYY